MNESVQINLLNVQSLDIDLNNLIKECQQQMMSPYTGLKDEDGQTFDGEDTTSLLNNKRQNILDQRQSKDSNISVFGSSDLAIGQPNFTSHLVKIKNGDEDQNDSHGGSTA